MGFDLIENRRRILDNSLHIATTSGNIATFDTGTTLPLVSCLLKIEPNQDGDGDPSPTNVREISGWTGTNIHISSPIDGRERVEHIDWESLAGAVFGGTYEAITGVFTVTMAKVDLGSFTWKYRGELSSSNVFTADMPFKTNKPNFYCDHYKAVSNMLPVSQIPDKSIKGYAGTASDVLYIRDTSHANADSFRTAIAGVQLVYELDTPISYQLTGQRMTVTLGENRIWMDATGITEVTYWTH